MRRVRSQAGLSLVEVLVATAISSVVILGATTIFRDFVKGFVTAERKNVLVMIRTSVLNEITRKDSWVITYSSNSNDSFRCLFEVPFDPNCGISFPDDRTFTVLNAGGTVVLPITNATPNSGFTKEGVICPSASVPASYPSAACPIRLTVEWNLKNMGNLEEFNQGFNYNYVPTNVMPYGYIPADYFPSWSMPVTKGDYGYFGTVGAQIEVVGTFTVHSSIYKDTNPDKYGFRIIKEVP